MLKVFHQRAPYAVTGLILLLLLTFAKVVNGNCWEKPFYYKLPHSKNCGLCRICPQNVVDNPKTYQRHIQKKCQHNKPLKDGRLAHCHSLQFDPPSCEKPNPQVGVFNCTIENEVYSSCHLLCPQGHSASRSGNITCTASLNWDKPWPVCVAGRHLDNPKGLNDAAVVCIVIFSVAVVGFIIIVLAVRTNGIHPCQKDIENGETTGHQLGLVSLMLKPSKLVDKQKQIWAVVNGCVLTIEPRCQNFKVVYFVLLKRGFKHRKVYTNKPTPPTQIVIQNIRDRHSGKYDWIVGLENGTKETGSFRIKVIKDERQFKESTSSLSEEKTSLTDIDNEVSDEDKNVETACEDMGTAENILENQLKIRDTEVVLSRCSGSGFAQLMKSRRDINRLCILFDREYKDGQISWHTIAISDLLQFDQDFVSFLEYHLRGKLYRGPMWYILSLMRQRGVSLQCFVEHLQDHQPEPNTAVELLQKYL